MEYSDDSDIDSAVTPIEAETHNSHGQVLESDSLSDFYLHDVKRKHKRRERRQRVDEDLDRMDLEDFPNLSRGNLQQIYKELQDISLKLKDENRYLYDREQKLKERERMVSISQQNIQTITEHGVKQKWTAMEQKHKAEVSQLDQVIKEKSKENKRLKDNFETLKQANDALKTEFESLQKQHEKLEKQAISVQARLTNLQKKQEFEARQKEVEVEGLSSCQPGAPVPKTQKPRREGEEKKMAKPQRVMTTPNGFDVMAVLLDWISDAHLRYTVTEQPTPPPERFTSQEYVQEKVFKVFPSLVELLRESPGHNLRFCLPCLQFIYWAVVHVEHSLGQQKTNLSSTLRRLGEELYRPKSVRFSDSDRALSASTGSPSSPVKTDKSKEGVYFKSSNIHVRLLSSLIILKTLSQADILAHVLDILKSDLKSDIAKELFLYYQATGVVLQYLKPANKPFMGQAMDVFLQMSMESPFLPPFLESCSNESWFRTIAMVLRAPSQDKKLLEKLSIILQKLSKIKSNKKFFEVYTIIGIVQELSRGCGSDDAFFALNLKSILFNLNVHTKNSSSVL